MLKPYIPERRWHDGMDIHKGRTTASVKGAMMNTDDLTRFADDLRDYASLDVALTLDPKPDGLHVLTIKGLDFYFCADGSGYDGWGQGEPKGGNGHVE